MKKILTFVSWLSVLVLWGCSALVYVNPAHWGKYWAVICLGFPLCVAAVLVSLVLCLLFRPKLALISVVGLLGCCGSLREYCPINLTSPPPKGAIKVLSYNTMSWDSWALDQDSNHYEVVQYVCSERPDVACLQEVLFRSDDEASRIERQFKRSGYTFVTVFVGANRVGIVSRWPVVKQEVVTHSESNGAVAFYLLPRRADTLIVVSAHLESMRLSQDERDGYHTLVKNPNEVEEVHGKLALLQKIATGGERRALQADTLAAFIDKHAGQKFIVMGDFNDTPISYAHHQVCSRLTDCYRATGNGIGRSFNRDAIYVRIDNIFCSSHFKPFAMKVDKTVPFSDHYPILGWLQPITGGRMK